MKQKLLFKTLALCFLFLQFSQAQEKLDCNSNFRKALSYLKEDQNIKKDSLKAIDLLKPCLKQGDANAQLLMSRLYMVKKDKKHYKKAFKLLKKSAKQGNAIAMGDLGVLYKYGHGCNLNFNKARKWFKKGAKLGNDKAMYSLGYLYLKGFGTIAQDYSKAIGWFEKSKHPMAKYWLGVCYYYGYGVEKNIGKANELLGTNFTNVIANDNGITSTGNTANEIPEQLETSHEDSYTLEDVTDQTLYGTWTGVLLKFDWSANHIEKKYPFTIAFTYDSINEIPSYSLKIENQQLKGTFSKVDNSIYFEDLNIILPHASFKKEIPTKLN